MHITKGVNQFRQKSITHIVNAASAASLNICGKYILTRAFRPEDTSNAEIADL